MRQIHNSHSHGCRWCMVAAIAMAICPTNAVAQPPAIDSFLLDKESVAKLDNERALLIRQLIAVVEIPFGPARDHERVTRAMEVLGTMRAPEAIDVLCRFISFPKLSHPDVKDSVEGFISGGMLRSQIEYPRPPVAALIAIGDPCIPKVVAKLAETDALFEQEACTAVLWHLNRRQTISTQLNAALEKTPLDRQKRLKQFIDQILTGKR